MSRPRISILTFGCRANQYERDAMECQLRRDYDVVDEPADVYILNACSVTRLAERKARQAARRVHREAPSATIVLVGCLADAVDRGLSGFDAADLTAGNAWKGRIGEVVRAALSGTDGPLPQAEPLPLDDDRSDGPRSHVRALLRVQDGCARACTYCLPTIVRGPSRSKSVAAAVAEGRRLVDRGFSEIVLTGISLAQYAPPDGRLHDLAHRLLEIDALRRLRIASINPAGLTDALLDAFAADRRFCRHIHVPLQSGDDRILAAMGRGYAIAGYEAALGRARERLDDVTFGADVIVGFPGEDEAAFRGTCDVVERVGFANLHVFRYSPRTGTAAAHFSDQVPERVKRARAERLRDVWSPIRRSLLDNRIGSTQDVLVEEGQDGRWHGHTRDYFYVSFDSATAIPLGVEQPVRITGVKDDHLEGVSDDRNGSR